jgi:hypothetical protein
MSKAMKTVVLTTSLVISMCLSSAYPQFGSPCSQSAMCPDHGVTANFTGNTKKDSKRCTWGQYSHRIYSNGTVSTHSFWVQCACP